MNRQVIVREEAKKDLAEGYAWYEKRQPGLGRELVFSVEAAIIEIGRRPLTFQIIYKNVRRAVIKRFPYTILFIESNDVISVIAIFHARRNPRIWQRRTHR